ncbi:MAG: VTT domain-containing protein [Patescibacteria group bacterium]|nr:VTT domain-containing protein [Patescibacteria group bacterium]MDE1944504.1 VTT domain-containing protein [Patescibacteria group bacterium]MDE1945114.1 VTT domain-containing protein [Patescibacteria group bacterium]MDE2058044.1 VTT domain-containing protein [Patescibacteria group bacterium]
MENFLLACAHLDPLAIVRAGGYAGVALLVFAESGLLIGIFLPGDSLLFAAGLLAGSGLLRYLPLATVVALAAILGDTVGYWFGRRVGSALFKRPDSRLFKREYLERTERFYTTYGPRAVLLARFVPIVRTLAPVLAGVARMRYATFLSYNMLGGIIWGAGVVSLGYFLGTAVPGIQHYVLPISLGIIVVSFLPIALNIVRGRRAL